MHGTNLFRVLCIQLMGIISRAEHSTPLSCCPIQTVLNAKLVGYGEEQLKSDVATGVNAWCQIMVFK